MKERTEKQIEQLVNEYKEGAYTVENGKRAVKIHVQRDLSEYRNVVEKEPRRLREDPVAFMFNVGLYYQGAVGEPFFLFHFINVLLLGLAWI